MIGMSMVAVLAAGSATTHAADGYGLAAGRETTACVATTRHVPSFPQTIRIVRPGPALEPGTVSAQIVSALPKPCAALEHSDTEDAGGRPYRFYALQAEGEPAPWHGVAVFPDTPAASLRACASGEGLHFTAWRGTPLRSERLWHAYAYLGHDVEPSCVDEEVR